MGNLDRGNEKTVKKRRSRTTFSTQQLDELETIFQKSHYPDLTARNYLASTCSLSDTKIQVVVSLFIYIKFNLIYLFLF